MAAHGFRAAVPGRVRRPDHRAGPAVVALPLLRPLRLLRLLTLLSFVNRRARSSLRGQVIAYVAGLTALVLLLAGIALLGVVTAAFASWLIERVAEVEQAGPTATRQDLAALTAEVAALRAELQSKG